MIRLEGVSKRYGAVVALDKSDLAVDKGEFVTLLGSSGSGKTTLLNVIAGMIAPTTGRVLVDGEDITSLPPNRRNLGMVFQNYALLPHMTIFENIAFPLRIRGVSNAEIRKRVMDVLDIIRLPQIAQRKPRELSGGQQQRVSLARCIVYNPSLILMDEPLGALDRRLREQMQVEIKKIQTESGITMLYVTHDQEEALSMSDRIVLMDNGKILQIGSPSDLYFRPKSLFAATFLGMSNILRGRFTTASGGGICLPGGEEIRLSSETPMTGEIGCAMVRPENVKLAGPDAQPNTNEVVGELVMSVMLGGITNHHVELADGTRLIAQEQTRIDRAPPLRGERIRLRWEASDTIGLPE